MKRRPDYLRLIALLIVLLGIIYYYFNTFSPTQVLTAFRIGTLDRPLNIMILGTDITFDSITGRATLEVGRTDTILLLHLDPYRQKANLVSIPRDSYVEIPGHGYSKINAAYVWGRTELIQETIEKLTGLKIDKYIIINTQGLRKLVDLLGGVEVEIEKDLYYVDRAQNLHIDLKKGKRKLSGREAEGFIRFRHDAMADLGRIERQQQFLKSLVHSLATPQALLKSPFIIGIVTRNVKSDFSLKEFIILANTIRMLGIDKINAITIPATDANNEAGSVLLLDRSELQKILLENF